MNEPTTRAGRRLLAVLPGPNEHGDRVAWEDAILAIEQEAVAKYRRELRERAGREPGGSRHRRPSVGPSFKVGLMGVPPSSPSSGSRTMTDERLRGDTQAIVADAAKLMNYIPSGTPEHVALVRLYEAALAATPEPTLDVERADDRCACGHWRTGPIPNSGHLDSPPHICTVSLGDEWCPCMGFALATRLHERTEAQEATDE